MQPKSKNDAKQSYYMITKMACRFKFTHFTNNNATTEMAYFFLKWLHLAADKQGYRQSALLRAGWGWEMRILGEGGVFSSHLFIITSKTIVGGPGLIQRISTSRAVKLLKKFFPTKLFSKTSFFQIPIHFFALARALLQAWKFKRMSNTTHNRWSR